MVRMRESSWRFSRTTHSRVRNDVMSCLTSQAGMHTILQGKACLLQVCSIYRVAGAPGVSFGILVNPLLTLWLFRSLVGRWDYLHVDAA
jgi:hypothetical protein